MKQVTYRVASLSRFSTLLTLSLTVIFAGPADSRRQLLSACHVASLGNFHRLDLEFMPRGRNGRSNLSLLEPHLRSGPIHTRYSR